MIATAFDEETTVLHPPEGMTCDEVFALSVARATFDGHPCIISCWKPTEEEWDEMCETGRIWIAVMGNGMPPILPTGHNPFEQGWAKHHDSV